MPFTRRMTNKTLAAIVFLWVLPLFETLVSAELKIRSVDVAALYEGYLKTQKVEARLQDRMDRAIAQMDEMLVELEAEMQVFKKLEEQVKVGDASNKDLEKTMKAIGSLQQKVKVIREDNAKQQAQQEASQRKTFLKEIETRLKTLSDHYGLDLIFDSSSFAGADMPQALFANKHLDITAELLQALNHEAPAIIEPTTTVKLESILMVDWAKLYEGFYRVNQGRTKLQGRFDSAKAKLDELISAGEDAIKEYQRLVRQSKDRSLTPEQRAVAKKDADQQMEKIRKMQEEAKLFRESTNNQLTQQQETQRKFFMNEINAKIAVIARQVGFNLALDKSSKENSGLPKSMINNASLDATQEVLEVLNSDAPE